MAAGPSSQELYGKFADLRAEGPVHPQTPDDTGGNGGTAAEVSNADVTQAAITAVLDRLPNLRLDPEADPKPVILGQGFRSPDRLPVLFG